MHSCVPVEFLERATDTTSSKPRRRPVFPVDAAAPVTVSFMRRLARVVGLVLFLAVLCELGRTVVSSNFHVVIPEKVYRSGQPSHAMLERLVRDHGIRTVINLRGKFEPPAEYEEECRSLRDLGLCQMDAALLSYRIPTANEARQLITAIDTAVDPVLIHCQSGMDRTGLAAALVLLLRTETPLSAARMQLSLRYGHWPFGRAAALDRFLNMYDRWLQSSGQAHAPDQLRFWVRNVYNPDLSTARGQAGTAP